MKKIWVIFFTVITFLFPIKQLFADVSQNTRASVSVPPRNSDYQFIFASTDSATQFSQGKTLTYQITYGANSSGNMASNVSLIVNFSGDIAPDSTDVLYYVNGSATNAYNGAPAIVDIVNRTISWTISSLPAGITDQVVTFQLNTNSNYQGASTTPLTITANMSNQYVTLPTQSISQSYLFNSPFVTPTPTPIPTSTPTPTQTTQSSKPTNAPIPAPNIITPTPQSPFLQNISVSGITQNSGKIGISTSFPSIITLLYGTSPGNLSRSLSTTTYATYAEITIPDLASQTSYYFQTLVTTNAGQKITSDIFTFRTASPSTPPILENGTIVISNNGVIVTSELIQQKIFNEKSVTVVTGGTLNQFVLTFPATQRIKSIHEIVRNKNTSEINTFNNTTESNISMVETVLGVYVAKIISPLHVEEYDVFARIIDFSGNIVEQKIAELRVISPFMVYGKGENEPIEDARAYFYFYNIKTKKYDTLSKIYGNIDNPTYSDTTGIIHVVLPKGKYQVQVSELGYQDVQKNFELGANSGQDYPQIYLKKDPWNLFYILKYYGNAIGDFFTRMGASIQGLSISLRFFNLIGLTTTLGFIFISFLFFTFRTHISFQRIPIFFYHHLSFIINAKIHPYLYGTVVDKENHPLSHVTLYLVDPLTKDILTSTTSNANGAFYIKHLTKSKILLKSIKSGYEELQTEIDTTLTLSQKGIQIILQKGVITHFSGLLLLWDIVKDALGVFFETTLFVSIILEFLFLSVFGFWKTIPFFALSLLNIILWILYIRESLSKK